MRVTFSLLIFTLMFGSFTFNSSTRLNNLHVQSLDTEGKMLFSVKPKPNEAENPTPHRGSGRRDLIESLNNAFPVG